jgi:t-SNARE complex subunit (syntaxin)
MNKIEEQKKLMEIGLNEFSEKISNLKEIALDISNELDIHDKILDKIETKAETQTIEIKKINEKTKNAIAQTKNSTRFCVVVIFIIIVLAILGALGIYIASLFLKNN